MEGHIATYSSRNLGVSYKNHFFPTLYFNLLQTIFLNNLFNKTRHQRQEKKKENDWRHSLLFAT